MNIDKEIMKYETLQISREVWAVERRRSTNKILRSRKLAHLVPTNLSPKEIRGYLDVGIVIS